MSEQWDYNIMEERLVKHLAEYRKRTGHWRQIKRKAILIWIDWMRVVREGGTP